VSEKKPFDHLGAGASALAVCESILDTMISKGLITAQERDQIVDLAISRLSVNPELGGSAQNIRTIFNRP
jgi:hypothetical protein